MRATQEVVENEDECYFCGGSGTDAFLRTCDPCNGSGELLTLQSDAAWHPKTWEDWVKGSTLSSDGPNILEYYLGEEREIQDQRVFFKNNEEATFVANEIFNDAVENGGIVLPQGSNIDDWELRAHVQPNTLSTLFLMRHIPTNTNDTERECFRGGNSLSSEGSNVAMVITMLLGGIYEKLNSRP